MYMRLAFAVAAHLELHLEPEILFIDIHSCLNWTETIYGYIIMMGDCFIQQPKTHVR